MCLHVACLNIIVTSDVLYRYFTLYLTRPMPISYPICLSSGSARAGPPASNCNFGFGFVNSYRHATATLPTRYLHATATLPPCYRHATDTLPPHYRHATAMLPPRYFHATATLPPLK